MKYGARDRLSRSNTPLKVNSHILMRAWLVGAFRWLEAGWHRVYVSTVADLAAVEITLWRSNSQRQSIYIYILYIQFSHTFTRLLHCLQDR